MLKVIARQHIREGKMDEYLEAIRDLADATRCEPGCVDGKGRLRVEVTTLGAQFICVN